MSKTPHLKSALERLASALREVELPFAIIGGLAVILRGHDRATQDVDAVVMMLDEHLEAFVTAAERHGLRLRLADGLNFARQNRVVLLQAPDGTAVDVSMGLLPFEQDVVQGSEPFLVGESVSVPVASVEDLLIMKLTAGRKRDYEDVASLLELYPSVNLLRIRSTVEEYARLLENPELVARMDHLFN